jgi:peptidoglycan/xylan/chitin deacetylase (PgdA/CDA1 family)
MSPDTVQDSAPRTILLTLHKLQSHFSYGATNYSPRKLIALIKYLTDHNCHAADFSQAVATGPLPSFNTCSFVVSFDDAYRHLLDTLPPIMEHTGIRPIVFVPTGLFGKTNAWDYSHVFQKQYHMDGREIRELVSLGVRFESHGVSHRDLTGVSPETLAEELRVSREALENITGERVTMIAYPFGRCNAMVAASAEQYGYTAGFTSRLPSEGDTVMTLGRVPVYSFDRPSVVLKRLRLGDRSRLEHVKTRFIASLSGGTILLNRFRSGPA